MHRGKFALWFEHCTFRNTYHACIIINIISPTLARRLHRPSLKDWEQDNLAVVSAVAAAAISGWLYWFAHSLRYPPSTVTK